MAAAPAADETTHGLLDAVNCMLLDTLAVVARKDDPDRRKRQAQGIAKAKAAGLYRGRQSDIERERLIRSMLEKGAGPPRVPAGPRRPRITKPTAGPPGAPQCLQAPHPASTLAAGGTCATRARLACPFHAMPAATIARGISLN